MKDLFSKQASAYAQFRPEYPPALYDFLLSHCTGLERAWDCGTGNGQAAKILCRHFEKVYASDLSQKQLALAFQAPNIEYSQQPAETTDFPDNFFDLIVVAQALHWFKHEIFFKEVRRTAKPGALFAAWGYEILRTNRKSVEERIDRFYRVITGPYWEPERMHIEDRYARVPFPFEQIPCPEFEIRVEWRPGDLEGYLNSWSAVQKCIRETGVNPVPALMEQMSEVWNPEEILEMRFPVFMVLGKISSL